MRQALSNWENLKNAFNSMYDLGWVTLAHDPSTQEAKEEIT